MPKETIELMSAILSSTKVTMMERERALGQMEPQLRNLRGSLQVNSSQRITFDPLRAFVSEEASHPATKSSLDYLLFDCWLLPQRREGKH
jgi:hypothetical protein